MKRQEHEDDAEIRLCGGGAAYHKDGLSTIILLYILYNSPVVSNLL